MFSVDELHQLIRSHAFEFLEFKTQSPLSKPHVRFSREQTLVAYAD
jgi:hypothetical protein